MKGSIRFIVGFLIVFGAVGAIENSLTNEGAMLGVLVAALGLGIMALGTSAMKSVR